MNHLFYIRHGESEYNQKKIWAGSYDTVLTPKGHDQAKTCALHISAQNQRFDLIITSNLARAKETAYYICEATNYPKESLLVLPEINERNFGELEGTQNLKASAEYILNEQKIDKYLGVETVKELKKRTDSFWSNLQNFQQNSILIVGHGAFYRSLYRSVNDLSVNAKVSPLNNCELTKLL